MAYDKRPGGRSGDNKFDRYGRNDGRREERQGGGRSYGKPSYDKPYGRSGSQRDGERRPSFRRDDDRPAPQNRFRKPYGEGSPRRATPPRGPIPPSQEFEIKKTVFLPHPLVEEEAPENLLVGRNPIREALRADRPLEKLLVADGELTGSAREILALAREKRVIVQYVDRARLDALCKGHQGMVAYASAAEYATVEDILDLAKERGEEPLVVVLDGVTDPHNLGAIIRSAECMGAHGVIVPERRAAGLVPSAVKAAAGALSYIKVARVVNLGRTLDELKQAGLWVTGAVMDAPDVREINLSGPVALVIGSEGEGISDLIRRKCDQLASLPLYGKIESLNASVAAGIMLYEAARSRHA